ncbi:MAG TPA: hypothetical protein VHG70_03460 [Nocardioidaceae bacterium]|nr:hypothetical protein [Nocardioidaceae bacterium]
MEHQAGLSGGVSTATALWLALASTLLLTALHLLAPRIRRFPLVPEPAMASFAGGIAVSYVFLHLLPELAQGNRELRELFAEETTPSPLVELGIFLVALTGFCLFYALERLAERRTTTTAPSQAGAAQVREPAPASATDVLTRTREDRPNRAAFWLHLAAFGIYNAVITYTLPLTYRTGVAFAVLFTVAMGLHFVLSDRGLEEHYGSLFDRWTPRLVLAGALVTGWVLAVAFAPTRSVTVSVLIAFLAGSVLLNVFKEEIPTARRSSLPWFLSGLVAYAALLAALTALR